MEKKLLPSLVITLMIVFNVQFVNSQNWGGLTGFLKYTNISNSPLRSQQVHLWQGANDIAQGLTNVMGSYEVWPVDAGAYDVKVNWSEPWGGVTVIDALFDAQYFAGMLTFSPLQLIVGDVNGSNYINSVDVLAIMKRWAGSITSWPSSAPDWYLSDANGNLSVTINSCTFPDACVTYDNLFGTCYGDVNSSYLPPIIKTKPTVSLQTSGLKHVKSGEAFNLPITTYDRLNAGAIGLVLSWNADKYTLNDIQFLGPTLTTRSDHWYDIVDGILKIAWYNVDGVELGAGDTLVMLNITPSEKQYENTSDGIEILTGSEIADSLGTVNEGVKLLIPKIGIINPGKFSLEISLFPNPSNQNIEFNYIIPEDGNVSLIVYDVLGHEITQLINCKQIANQYQKNFDVSNLSDGAYTYRFIFNNIVKTGRLVISR